jgi:hypothetical protein
MRIAIAIMALAASIGSTGATTPEYWLQLESKILSCAEATPSEAREACLKALAETVQEARRLRASPPGGASERRIGQWTIYHTKDRMTDVPLTIVSVLSDYYDGGLLPGTRVRFSVACRFGSKGVLVEIRKLMIEPPKVFVRIDSELAFEMPWQISGDRQSILVLDQPAGAFVARLLDKEVVRFRIDVRGQTIDAGFKIAGLREALASDPANCGK